MPCTQGAYAPAVLAGGCALRRTTRGGLTQDLVHARREDMRGHRADHGLSHLPLVEEHEGGNARDAIALGHRGVLVDVELAHGQTPCILGRDLLHDWSHETTRTTPGGPKIDQHGTGGVEDVVLKSIGRDGHWRYHTCVLSSLGCETRTTAGTGHACERREARSSRPESRVVRVSSTRAHQCGRAGRTRAASACAAASCQSSCCRYVQYSRSMSTMMAPFCTTRARTCR